MDVNKYKLYLRDINPLNNTEYLNLLYHVIKDIAMDTKIFSRPLGFKVSSCLNEYDIRAIFNLSSTLKNNVLDVKYNIEESNVSTVVDLDKVGNETCKIEDNDITTEFTLQSTNEIFLYYTSIKYVEDYGLTNKVLDVTTSWFTPITDSMVITEKAEISRYIGSDTFELDVYATCIYVPIPEKITEEEEMLIESAIIAGLKYYASDLYLNATNEQVSNILYQRYYSKKKQIAFNHPQNTM